MVRRFFEVFKCRGLKVIGDKSKIIVLNGEEGLEVRRARMGQDWSMSRNINTSDVLDESGTDDAECHRKVTSQRKVGGVIRFLATVRDLQLECARVLQETCLFLCVVLR